jgi:hypothetical protein
LRMRILSRSSFSVNFSFWRDYTDKSSREKEGVWKDF